MADKAPWDMEWGAPSSAAASPAAAPAQATAPWDMDWSAGHAPQPDNSMMPFSPEVSVEDAQRMVRYLKGAPLGIVRGLMDIPEGLNQLAARGMEAVLPEGSAAQKFMSEQRKQVEQFQREGEEDYRKMSPLNPGEFDPGRLAGTVAATAPIAGIMPGAGAAGLFPRIASGAASGGVTGALQPVEPGSDDYWNQKLKQVEFGAGGGAVAPVIAGTAARVISPNVSNDVKALMQLGVRPTPGQILGGSANRVEEAMQSIPLVGDTIKAARGRAVEDFNRASINRALDPIGEKLDKTTPLGRDAIAEMHEKIGSNYDKLVPTLNVQTDPQFIGALKNLIIGAKMMPQETGQQFGNTLQNLVINKFSAGGHMTGQTFKEMESELGGLASNYTHSSLASERQLGDAYKQLQLELRQLLTRSNPDKAEELAAANTAFANALRVEGAAAKTGTDQGVFTPAHLLQSTRQLDPSLRKGAFARGDALMQDLADAGKTVLGNKVPDSGTPFRSAVLAAGPLAGIAAWNPLAAGGLAAGGLTTMAGYTRPGVSLLAKLLASRPQSAADLARLIRSPAGSPLAGLLAAQGATGP